MKPSSDQDLESGIRRKSTKRRKSILKVEEKKKWTTWTVFSRIITFWAPSVLLKCFGKREPEIQQAFREKVALCFIILLMCGSVAFLTFGLNIVLCPSQARSERITWKQGESGTDEYVWILGEAYEYKDFVNVFSASSLASRKDYTNILTPDDWNCEKLQRRRFEYPCQLDGSCLERKRLSKLTHKKSVALDWDDIRNTNRLVYNGNIMDMTFYLSENNQFLGEAVDKLIRSHLGSDITFALMQQDPSQRTAVCLIQTFKIANLSKEPPGCFAANLILILSLIIILAVVVTRFVMAVAFDWFISHQLDKLKKKKTIEGTKVFKKKEAVDYRDARKSRSSLIPSFDDLSLAQSKSRGSSLIVQEETCETEEDLYTILLVTCYSENEESLRTTIDSLANTDYHDQKKILFIIADGIVTGKGNSKSTPDILLDMLDIDNEFINPEPMSYLAISGGSKQHNMAKVYAGDYHSKGRSVPVILVVKCGNPDESASPKPGNRGKRDSQLILMNFLQRVMFDDRMSPLDFDLFNKIYYLLGVTPDVFEIVLMVDADTKVAPDSLARMVSAMKRDPLVMGLCGETRIANKKDSWVTAIQVFEYYISHHLGKAFESVFGGVTCLPGCFCMYRIKTKKNGNWVPILANPEIIEEYSQKTVDTLHKKNLLLLGEDRFLTTLMLKTFPKRKMIFVPQAYCKTVVPNEFKVLLSQRRRWINSTIHNLMELVLVRDLCGIFCFSMQFVIFLELIGTVVLPAAVVLTFVLIASLFLFPGTSLLPLLLLSLVLGLPAVLILLTTRKVVYIMWMFAYLLALPIWNFILPVYAYWHFDDFSWGETRKVAGSTKDSHEFKEGEFDFKKVPLKKWSDWMCIYQESYQAMLKTDQNKL